MIKARGEFNGRPLLLVGLSAGNCRRLLAGEPIRFDTAELGLPGMRVLILGGDTEESITADLRRARLITDDTAEHGTNGGTTDRAGEAQS